MTVTSASVLQDPTSFPSHSAPLDRSASWSTASCPASVTIPSRPSVGQDGKSYSLICISEKQKYFCKGGWTGQSPTRSTDLPVRQIKQPVRQQIAGWVELSAKPVAVV